MKKISIFTTLIILCLCGFAQNNNNWCLNIKERGLENPMLSVSFGESHSFGYEYDDVTNVSSLIVTADNQVVTTLLLNQQYIIDYTEGSLPSAVKELIADSKINLKDGVAFVSNLKANDIVNVYAANGTQVASAAANNNGVAQINLSSMPKGIIVIKAGNNSFKIKL